jgi:YesN/AraC family two-component response regulator
MNKPKIMIVEDEVLVAMSLRLDLVDFGYDVAELCSTGEMALATVEQVKPDLVLMDISLSGKLTGIETAKRMKDLLDIPIIFLSGYSDQEMQKEALSIDQTGYFLKPFNVEELQKTLQQAVQKK